MKKVCQPSSTAAQRALLSATHVFAVRVDELLHISEQLQPGTTLAIDGSEEG
jgi:hypothetical protein